MLSILQQNAQQIAEMAWRATAIFAAVHVLAAILRRRSAAEKHGLWLVAVVCALAVPFWPMRAPAVMTISVPVMAVASTPISLEQTANTAASQLPLWPLAWLGGAAVLALYSLCGVLLLGLRHRGGRSVSPLQSLTAEVPLRRTVRVYESSTCKSPMTWGVLRPVILLPLESRQWSVEKQRSVLLHELPHIQRFDFLTQLLAQAMRALYWFQPLAWTTAAALRRESEKACDDAVLRLGEQPTHYARHLLDLACVNRSAGIAMARKSQLEGRIRSLLNPSVARHGVTTRSRLAGAVVLAVLVVLVSGVVIRAQSGGALFGSVLDASRAVIPQAEVRLISTDGKLVEATICGADGVYRFSGVPAGQYKVEVRSPGFAMLAQPGVEVKSGTPTRADLNLELGKVMERIDVVGKRKPATAPLSTPARVPQRIRVGGNVQATKLLGMVKPDYPQHLQDEGIEGMVLLEGVISKDGTLLSLHSLSSLVNPDLIRAAMNAVSQWHYQPTLLNGQPVEVITTITVNFKLAP